MTEQLVSDAWVTSDSGKYNFLMVCSRYLSRALAIAGVSLFFYGLAWSYSTSRYLKGFSDAIVPLEGSAEQKTLALLGWLRHEPDRREQPLEGFSLRDPVGIVQNAQLLKVCGSSSNAFINLAEAAGVKTRRLLLLDAAGEAKHVVVEVKWDDRWVVVDPSFRSIFRNQSGTALSKEDLRNPQVFQDAVSRIPNYNPEYTFERTIHLRLTRIPALGKVLRQTLRFLFPQWEETANWGYLPEHPSLWPIVISLPLLLLGMLIHLVRRRYGREELDLKTVGFRKRLIDTGRMFLQKST